MTGRSSHSKGPALRELFSKTLSSERGISLIIVLWVLAFLMLIVVEFAYTMRIETAAVRNFKDEAQARHLALAGVKMGIAEVAGKYDIVFVGKDAEVLLGRKVSQRLSVITAKREFELSGGRATYRIEDESGKLNINSATREMIISLLRATGVDVTERDVIADSILDWRDENSFHHLNGAEDDYYASLPEPYGAKNAPFDMIEELLLVKGVTPAIFFGDGNVPPEFGLPEDASPAYDDSTYEGIRKYVTVNGYGKVNMNTADTKVLDAILGKGISMEIKLRRETEGYFDWPMYGAVVSSEAFTIHSVGEAGGIRSAIKAIVERAPNSSEVTVSYWNEVGTGLY